MIFERMEKHPGARFLLVLACIVVVIAGLRVARPILVPFVLALFIAVVSMPVMFWLGKRGVWSPVAVALTVLIDALVFAGMILLVVVSLANLDEQLPRYLAAFQSLTRRWILDLEANGIPAGTYLNLDINPARVFAVVRGAARGMVEIISVAFLVGVIMVFILAEATVFPFKFLAILRGSGTGPGTLRIAHIIQEVQAYLWLKTLTSLATGVCVTVLCQLAGVDFAVLLGMLAFVLHFVPTIGSILASIPAVVLALLIHGEVTAIVVALGYLAVSTVIGSLIDPHIMGHRLGLSTLVVVLSLLFWGWVWGPVGALLSVPLTMVLKIVLQNVPDLRWIAVLLDKKAPMSLDVAVAGTAPAVSETAKL